jgi:Zn ribbon nucleic-acid-binding protein
MGRKKTHEKFCEEVYELVDDEYSVLGKYINAKTKIKMRHNVCNYEWDITPDNFLQGKRCPKCAGRTRDTNQFKEEVDKITNGEYELLGEYKKWNIKTLFRHNLCGFEYKTTPNIFLNGSRCPKCAGNLKYNQNTFEDAVYDLVGNEYTVLGLYINNRTKIKMKHNKCNHIWDIQPDSFLLGTRCPMCQHRSFRKTNDEFIKAVYDLVGNEYVFLEDYINNETKIKVKHQICGFDYKVKPIKFLSGQRCPKCNESKGEKIISNILRNNLIKFDSQCTFPDCRYINPLEFDFYLSDYDTCIEFQGLQHYKPVDFAGKGEEWANQLFIDNQIRDNIKRDYCKNNNIKLIEIPYWDFNNIEKILNNKMDLF